LIGVESLWGISEIDQDLSGHTAKIHVILSADAKLDCQKKCGKEQPVYDHRVGQGIPQYLRVSYRGGGKVASYRVSKISVAWADTHMHYTTQFEACVIGCLFDATSISTVSKSLG